MWVVALQLDRRTTYDAGGGMPGVGAVGHVLGHLLREEPALRRLHNADLRAARFVRECVVAPGPTHWQEAMPAVWGLALMCEDVCAAMHAEGVVPCVVRRGPHRMRESYCERTVPDQPGNDGSEMTPTFHFVVRVWR